MKRNYIGLASTFHDSALAIVNSEGEVVFAEATERYLQNKKSIGIMPDVIFRIKDLIKTYCDPDAELVLAHSWSGDHARYIQGEILDLQEKKQQAQELYDGAVPFFIHRELENHLFQVEALANATRDAGKTLSYELSQMEDRYQNRIIHRRYDHHLTHAATACFTSPFHEGVVAIIDGEGEDGRANEVFTYRNGKITRLPDAVPGPTGSLGIYFWLVTQACGFGILTGEEWKVMGLAPYGQLDEAMYPVLKSLLKVNDLTLDRIPVAKFTKVLWELYQVQRKQDAPPISSANLAYTGQVVFEETVFQLLNNLYKRGISENLIMGGGCCLNSTANGKYLQETPFKRLHIYGSPADDGNALGAALLAYQQDHPDKPHQPKTMVTYLGSEMKTEAYENLKRFSRAPKLNEYPGEIHLKAAQLLADRKIIGWAQGKAEFGPRALGNRSILADPRWAEVKEEINARVKFREEFRPFAPSILHEHGPEYFEHYQETPYMERTLLFKPEVRERVPGVVHANQTGRLQTVKREWNQRYYDLIKAFYDLTGVPIVLNTSFNIMGKPIIHSVEDAIAVFYTTGLDALIIGDLLIEK